MRRKPPGGDGESTRDRLAELGYAAGWRVVRVLPGRVTWPLFAAAADRAARRRGPGTRRLAGNLRRVVGPDLPEEQFQELTRQALRSYARYWLQAFRLPNRSMEQHRHGLRIVAGFEALASAVAAGRGVVLALPHAGNWDAAGAWVAAQGWPITTVAERLKPEGLYERFLAFRRGLGMEIVPAAGADRPVVDILADRVRAGHVVPLVADRDLSSRGVPVRFFGADTRMPAGPALLALRTGAPLFVVSLWFDADQPCARVEGPLPVPAEETGSLDVRVRALTQRIADRFAAGIAAHPQDWHMMQRLWLEQPAATSGAAPDAVAPAAPDAVAPAAPDRAGG